MYKIFSEESLQALIDNILNLFNRSRIKRASLTLAPEKWTMIDGICSYPIDTITISANTTIDIAYSDILYQFLINNHFTKMWCENNNGVATLKAIGQSHTPQQSFNIDLLYYETEK